MESLASRNMTSKARLVLCEEESGCLNPPILKNTVETQNRRIDIQAEISTKVQKLIHIREHMEEIGTP